MQTSTLTIAKKAATMKKLWAMKKSIEQSYQFVERKLELSYHSLRDMRALDLGIEIEFLEESTVNQRKIEEDARRELLDEFHNLCLELGITPEWEQVNS